MSKHTRYPSRRGARNPHAKLPAVAVAYIRRRAALPGLPWGWQSALWRDVMSKYGIRISRGTLGDILHGRRWGRRSEQA